MSTLVQKILGHEPGKAGPDGFGQSLLDDVRFYWRFRHCRKLPVDWQRPNHAEQELVRADAFLGRFADDISGLAEVAGRQWIVMERDWHGFPDPPRYAFFAFENMKVWAAADFHVWPLSWHVAEEAGS